MGLFEVVKRPWDRLNVLKNSLSYLKHFLSSRRKKKMLNRAVFAQPARFAGAEIRKNLFLGNAKMANSIWLLQQLNITVVVNCAIEVESKLFGHQNLTHYFLSMNDDHQQDILTILPKIIPIIDQHLKNGEAVLIHCAQGISRSASILAGYLMWSEKKPFQEILKSIKSKREVASPNLYFCRQLEKFEQDLRKDNRI